MGQSADVLEGRLGQALRAHLSAVNRIADMEAQLERAYAALAFYADLDSWRGRWRQTWTDYGYEYDEDPPLAYDDNGQEARQALGIEEPE